MSHYKGIVDTNSQWGRKWVTHYRRSQIAKAFDRKFGWLYVSSFSSRPNKNFEKI